VPRDTLLDARGSVVVVQAERKNGRVPPRRRLNSSSGICESRIGGGCLLLTETAGVTQAGVRLRLDSATYEIDRPRVFKYGRGRCLEEPCRFLSPNTSALPRLGLLSHSR
jgi:hypothetical protein